MGTRWVYRRPYFRVTKPKIPLHRGNFAPVIRHLRTVRRRRHIIVRRIAIVLASPAVNNMTMAPVRRPPAQVRPHIQPDVYRIVVYSTPHAGKMGPIQRMLKAVQRARRHIHARLRWQLLPETIPPIVTPTVQVHAVPRGSVFTAGAVEAAVFTAGAKRGRIGGDHG